MAQIEEPKSFIKACLNYKKEEYQEALSLFDSILSESPDDVDSLCMKGMTLSKIGRFEDALACCDKALEIESGNLMLLNNKGYFESILGNNEKAIKTFDDILQREPENVAVLYNKALCFSRLEKFEESTRIYDEILEIDPKHVDALYNKGNDLYKLGRHKEAKIAYEEVLKLNPDHSGAKNNRTLSESQIDKKNESAENPQPKEPDDLFAKLHDWVESGMPETKEFESVSALAQQLPKEKEEAFAALTKAKEMTRQNFAALDVSDPIDIAAKELAKAMSTFDGMQPSEDAGKEKSKQHIPIAKKKKSHKSVIALAVLISAVGFIGVYDAYPDILFSFNPSQMANVMNPSRSFDDKLKEAKPPDAISIDVAESRYPQIESGIVDAFNEKRIEIGRGPFVPHPELNSLALKHSQDMASHNRVDHALSSDGLPVTREYADKLPVCIENSSKYAESSVPKSALNVYSGAIPADEFTADTVVSSWIEKDVREIMLRSTVYGNVGTGVSVSSDGTLYVSQIYC